MEKTPDIMDKDFEDITKSPADFISAGLFIWK